MTNRSVTISVFLCLIVCLAAVGIAFLPDWRRREGVEQCVAAFSKRDPLRDARIDYQRGERRFFFVNHNGVVGYLAADGVPYSAKFAKGTQGCEPRKEGNFRAPVISTYLEYGIVPGRHCCDYDPPLTACGKVHAEYNQSYNAEMARISPLSVKEYCR